MSQNTSIIFGGTGLIGSALAARFVHDGEKVISISRHIPEKKEIGVEYFAFDIGTDLEKIKEICGIGNTIFLLTGQTYSNFDPEKEKNTFGKLLDVISKTSSEKVIFTSSALVYGDCEKLANEDHVLAPKDEYSVFKVECEKMIREKLSGIPVGILRLTNVYGSEKNKGFVGLVFKKILEESDMKVNGDGMQERDYIFLDDVVSAMVTVKKGLKESDTINIATGKSETLLDVITTVLETTRKKMKYEITGIPISEVVNSRVDNMKLIERYGFTPQIFLKEGIQKTWDRYNKKD